MPVGLGLGRVQPRDRREPARLIAPRGFHPAALGLAAAAPVLATVFLLLRLAA